MVPLLHRCILTLALIAGCRRCGEPPPERPDRAEVEAPEPTAPEVEEAPDPLAELDLPPPIRITVEDEDAFDAIAERTIGADQMPGAVVIVGRSSGPVFRRAYGSMAIEPERLPMRVDALFDLASVTKLFTTALVMQAIDEGELALESDVGGWIPALRGVTVEALLTHTSGLPAVTPLAAFEIEERSEALAQVFADAMERRRPAGEFHYSDIGFLALGELASAVFAMPLEDLVIERLGEPLGMDDLGYGPVSDPRVAPTERAPRRAAPGEPAPIVRGETIDPRAWRLGGVAGHAGLFASADDLARFAEALLSGRAMSAESLAAVTTARSLPSDSGLVRRGLGVDMDAPAGFSERSFGHGGYAGVWLWVDPAIDGYLVVATHRVHPDGEGRAGPIRTQLARQASEALPRALPPLESAAALGIDVLRAESFERLAGRRVALLTHAAARARDGERSVDLFARSDALELVRIFTPEHGLRSAAEGHVADGELDGIPTVSLFGRRRDPPPESLADVDAVVIDLQDVGARFYTYFATMNRLLRAAAAHELPVWVLDRPNPLGGAVAGPISVPSARSFVNHHPLPILHGMTAGEMARFLVTALALELELEVVPMVGWERAPWTEAGLRWVPPSPNLPDLDAVRLYPGVALVEGSNVSVGRGTDRPFRRVGAPWLDPDAVLAALPAEARAGVTFTVEAFTPAASRHRGRRCRGLRLHTDDPEAIAPVALGLGFVRALHEVHPEEVDLDAMSGMIADPALVTQIREGAALHELLATESEDLRRFRRHRSAALLYED